MKALRVAAALVLCVAAVLSASRSLAASKSASNATAESVCYNCHAPIKEFHAGSKHKGVSCSACHEGIDKHLANASQRPVTRTDRAACGACHKLLQYDSFATVNWNRTARFEKSQLAGPSPNPAWEKLMYPHGFTREHNLLRSHAFALLDQLVVDRAFGGRFEPKTGWQYLTLSGPLKVWDVLDDRPIH